MDVVLDFIRRYWIVGVLGIMAVAMFFVLRGQSDDIQLMRAEIEAMEEQIAGGETVLDGLPTDYDADAEKEDIESRTVTAEAIGAEVIAVDDALTAFYKTAEPPTEDEAEREAELAELREVESLDASVRNTEPGHHLNTWQLNPEWTLDLESVVAYQNIDSIPVVFSMETADGTMAGLIHATYDVEDHSLSNVSRHYTSAGLSDAAEIGGR